MFYIYIIYSSSSDRYYVGYSNDFNRRLTEHNSQEDRNTYTHKNGPWVLKAAFECGDIESQAIQIERFIKKQKSRSLLERMIRGEKLTGILAQLIRVDGEKVKK